MIRERGCVVRIAGSFAWVSCESRAGCERCAQGKGCGGGLLSKLLGDRLFQLRVPAPDDIKVGDQVQLGISERALLGASCLVYLLPLFALLMGALLGDFLGGDVPALLLGGSAFFSSFLALHVFRDRIARSSRFQPVILRV
ncbi:MAG: SoxR reducing system RseC family protein [Gammaproteobacteria bacterium]|nr:SoxR reducing system RseC family protein [Gammaproteobacteria bacterium]